MKALWWDHGGFCMLYKRLAKGRFRLPFFPDDAIRVRVTGADLAAFLEGILGPRSTARMDAGRFLACLDGQRPSSISFNSGRERGWSSTGHPGVARRCATTGARAIQAVG